MDVSIIAYKIGLCIRPLSLHLGHHLAYILGVPPSPKTQEVERRRTHEEDMCANFKSFIFILKHR